MAKTKQFLRILGVLAIALVFALTVVSCGDPPPDETETEEFQGGIEKSITITNITGGYFNRTYTDAEIEISDMSQEAFFAYGEGEIENNSVTLALYKVGEDENEEPVLLEDRFTGSGSYHLALTLYENDDSEYYFYTAGKNYNPDEEVDELGINEYITGLLVDLFGFESVDDFDDDFDLEAFIDDLEDKEEFEESVSQVLFAGFYDKLPKYNISAENSIIDFDKFLDAAYFEDGIGKIFQDLGVEDLLEIIGGGDGEGGGGGSGG